MSFYYNIMASGKLAKKYREHLIAPDCSTASEAKKYGNRRKEIVKAMLDGLVPMDERVKSFVEAQQKINKPVVMTYTVKLLCDALINDYKKSNHKSIDKIETHTDFFKAFFGEDRNIKTIDEDDITDMIIELRTHKNKKGETLSNATINRYMSSLRRAFNIIKNNKKIDFWINPCDGIKKFTEKEAKKNIIQKEQQQDFLDGFTKKTAVQKDIVELNLQLGLRINNVLLLNKNQIDLQNLVISIAPDENKTEENIKLKINKRAEEIIKKYYDNAEHYLFTHKSGKYKGQPFKSINKALKTAGKSINFENMTTHDIRRTVGTRVYKNTGNILIAQKVLHHKSSKTTEIYLDVSQQEINDAIDGLAD